ncbi:MAG: hypothetical protein ACLU0O_08750 [Collinsella sp.]
MSGNENATVTGVSPTGKQSTDSTITLTVSISALPRVTIPTRRLTVDNPSPG